MFLLFCVIMLAIVAVLSIAFIAVAIHTEKMLPRITGKY